MKNKKNIYSSILIALVGVTTLALVGTSYSWIKREWTPHFEAQNMTVETSGSLAIQFEGIQGGAVITDSVDLNETLDLEDFKLHQVSNLTGLSDDFFNIDSTLGHGYETFNHLQKLQNETYATFAKQHGYIEGRFLITCKAKTGNEESAFKKFVFFDPDESYIEPVTTSGEYDVSEAIRVSLTIEGTDYGGGGSAGSDINYLFRKTKMNGTTFKAHVGALNTKDDDGGYVINGLDLYLRNAAGDIAGLNPVCFAQNNNVYTFEDFNGGSKDAQGNLQFDSSRALFSMASIEQRWVTLRIWLEGYDENCVDEVAGKMLNFKLTFKSWDVEEV